MTTRSGRLTLTVLASGSSGNASVVHGASGAVLLDAGISARQIVLRMDMAGLDPTALTAIIVTHEHGDHMRGTRVLAQKLDIPVFATSGTIGTAGLDAMSLDVREICPGGAFISGGVEVSTFHTSHDAAEPVGCVFESATGERIGIVTDTGALTPGAREMIPACDVLGIECNHDEEMLENGPYPRFLKNRIASATGHLSNSTTATEVRTLAGGRLKALVALHVSETNNTPARARTTLKHALRDIGSGAHAICASRTTVPLTCDCAGALSAR